MTRCRINHKSPVSCKKSAIFSADEDYPGETVTREKVSREDAGIEAEAASSADAEEQDDGEDIYSV